MLLELSCCWLFYSDCILYAGVCVVMNDEKTDYCCSNADELRSEQNLLGVQKECFEYAVVALLYFLFVSVLL